MDRTKSSDAVSQVMRTGRFGLVYSGEINVYLHTIVSVCAEFKGFLVFINK